ncbi:transposase, partial [Candidatus Bathyarchaeota archaeon A05DMB-2]|nr:transposase [Candidatus Bathyarchaeota archaeon A05DMB-2]
MVVDELVQLVDEAGDPWRKPKRGRPAVHSPRKMAVICVLTVILGFSYRKMESLLHMLKLPWQEAVPDHSTIHEAFRRIPEAYLNQILLKSAGLCIAESGWVRGIVAADSTGVETDRYETVEVKMKKVRRRISVKYHVIAILDYNIIMAAKITSRRTADSPTLRQMLKDLPRMEDSIFNADRAYDSDRTCELVYWKMMKPNIKQRETPGRNRGLRYRRKAAGEFDEAVYRYRGLVEGIFGAEEVENGLKTRCRLRATQRRWGVARAIGHNLAVLNRLRCAKQLNITLKPILQNAEA